MSAEALKLQTTGKCRTMAGGAGWRKQVTEATPFGAISLPVVFYSLYSLSTVM